MRYQDKYGNETTEGTYLRPEDGSVKQVYVWQTGDESDFGINASNEAYLQAHGLGGFPQESYPLFKSDLSEVETCEPEMESWQLGMMEQSVYSGNVGLYLVVCAALIGGVGLGYHWQEWRPLLAFATEHYTGRQTQVRLGRKQCRLEGLCRFHSTPSENADRQSRPGILV